MACGDKCALIFTKTTRLADSGTQIELPTKKNGFSDAWVNLPLMLVGNFASGSLVEIIMGEKNVLFIIKIALVIELVFGVLCFFHVIYNNSFDHIIFARKEIFSYEDIFINADDFVKIPLESAKKQYPQIVKIFQKNKLIESDDEISHRRSQASLLHFENSIAKLREEEQRQREALYVRDRIYVSIVQWSRNYGVIEVYLKVQNTNDFSIKDIEIKCSVYGKSGTEIDSFNETIYDIVFPNSETVFPKINLGFADSQAATVHCKSIPIQALKDCLTCQ